MGFYFLLGVDCVEIVVAMENERMLALGEIWFLSFFLFLKISFTFGLDSLKGLP